MAKDTKKKSTISENYIPLGLGILVVVVAGALIFNYVKRVSPSINESTNTQVQQEEGKSEENVSLPTTHKVAAGEDLWAIAERYYKSGYNWVDIAQANNLSDPNILLADTELTIPSAEPKVVNADNVASETESVSVAAESTVSEEPAAITSGDYKVNEGDNLWDIAVRAYGDGYKWAEIAKANDLINPDLIHPGNDLKLPR